MHLSNLDIIIVLSFFVITFLIGMSVAHSAGKNKEEFFLGGRSMPWWLLGFSMVATTFSVDTPALVTNMVRSGGVAANWSWWAMLPGGMLTAFIYANLFLTGYLIYGWWIKLSVATLCLLFFAYIIFKQKLNLGK